MVFDTRLLRNIIKNCIFWTHYVFIQSEVGQNKSRARRNIDRKINTQEILKKKVLIPKETAEYRFLPKEPEKVISDTQHKKIAELEKQLKEIHCVYFHHVALALYRCMLI